MHKRAFFFADIFVAALQGEHVRLLKTAKSEHPDVDICVFHEAFSNCGNENAKQRPMNAVLPAVTAHAFCFGDYVGRCATICKSISGPTVPSKLAAINQIYNTLQSLFLCSPLGQLEWKDARHDRNNSSCCCLARTLVTIFL